VTREGRVNYTDLDDATLINLIAQQEADALAALYDRYSRLIFSVVRYIVGDGRTAEEVTLDVFTTVWRKAAQYQHDRASVPGWLTSIARHRAIDVLRRERVRPDLHSLSWSEISSEPRATGQNPESAAATHLERNRVRSAVAQLPLEQRQAIALAYFRGQTQSEIASTLNQPLGTVKTRIRLGLQKLRRMLEERD
jgi:RNA polymerase sigma-70 factor, ECF subfamily